MLFHTGHPKIERSVVYDKFKCLASTHFIKQCPNPVETLGVVQDEREMSRLYVVPPLAQQSKSTSFSYSWMWSFNKTLQVDVWMASGTSQYQTNGLAIVE